MSPLQRHTHLNDADGVVFVVVGKGEANEENLGKVRFNDQQLILFVDHLKLDHIFAEADYFANVQRRQVAAFTKGLCLAAHLQRELLGED